MAIKGRNGLNLWFGFWLNVEVVVQHTEVSFVHALLPEFLQFNWI